MSGMQFLLIIIEKVREKLKLLVREEDLSL